MFCFVPHRLDQCLELLIRTNRLPEAAFLARTYLPSQVSRVVKLWRESLAKVNQKVSPLELFQHYFYTKVFSQKPQEARSLIFTLVLIDFTLKFCLLPDRHLLLHV